MSTHATQTLQAAASQPQTQPWSAATRIAFRFCFIYFGLFCLLTQISTGLFPLPIDIDIPDPSTLWPMRPLVLWTATHILRITRPLIYADTGSGDRTYDWVLVFCLLLISAVATAVWSALDRKREDYVTLYKWFRLAIRFCVAGQMLGYGWAKAVPLQMPFPYLTRLVEPYGNFSPMGVLWASIGAAPAYEVFAGCAEILGGVLLILPRTTTLGALVCLADMTQVFMLNMTYDVPVKLFSFHLILMSLFLLAPDMGRLTNFFFLNRTVGASTQPPLFATVRRNRIALIAQVAFGLWLFGMNAYGSWQSWHKFGGGAPKSALYGIWDVEELTIDGKVRSPLLNDYGRWRRAIFDVPTRAGFQRMDDSLARYGASIKPNEKTLSLTRDDDKNWKADFVFERPAPDRLLLDGTMDGHKVKMRLSLLDRKQFLLLNRGFHWVQEYPFNR